MNPLNARTFVPPTPNDDAPFNIVGEQPGRQEVRRRTPFVGPAGKELESILNSVSIPRSQVRFSNVIKDLDRPLEYYFNHKTKEWSSEAKVYLELLKEELSNVKGKVIIATGNVPLYALTMRYGITKWRGSILESTLVPGKTVVPCIHPSTIIFPKNQFLNRRLIIFDILRAKDIIIGTYQPTVREIMIAPNYLETLSFLEYCYQEGLNGAHVAYDLEVVGSGTEKQVSCISFSVNMKAMSIPFSKGSEQVLSSSEELEVWRQICVILEAEEIKKVGQNLTFDAHFLLRRYGIKTRNMEDTMILQNIISPDYPKGLDFITSIWTDHPYYKADGKDFFKGVSDDLHKFWIYNATDSIICDEAYPKQLHTVQTMGNERIYKEQRKLIAPLTYMMERGIRVDIQAMADMDSKLKIEEERLRDELEEMVISTCKSKGVDYSWYTRSFAGSSAVQLPKYFWEILGAPKYKTKAKKFGFDDDVLKRLIRKDYHEAKLIQQIRKNRKLSSTYTNFDKIDDDGRLRCFYNPAGTRFSRLSSSASIFGKGMNMQNWPHSLLVYLTPDPGYVFYSFDLSQAENRIVAYVSGCQAMIDAFETGKDVHRRTAALILGKHEDEISSEEGSSPWRSNKSERDEGKTANHGLNYDFGYKNFALKNEMTEKHAKEIVERYHYVYPEVRQVFHNYVKSCLRSERSIVNLMGRKVMFHGKLEDATFKDAYPCIPQGTVGDIMNIHGINYIYYNQEIFEHVELLIQIHDSLGFQIPISAGWDYHAHVLSLIKKSFEIKLVTHSQREFVIPADLFIGPTLGKSTGKEIKAKNFPNDEKVLAKRLEEIWQEITTT